VDPLLGREPPPLEDELDDQLESESGDEPGAADDGRADLG
jgi:hypothetical protein